MLTEYNSTKHSEFIIKKIWNISLFLSQAGQTKLDQKTLEFCQKILKMIWCYFSLG